MPDLAAAQRILRTTFGFEAFRAGQGEIIAAVLDGRDVLAVMPTGSGKSLCYQLPALLRDGVTVVVSPLIALMRNQVAQLCGYGIAAAALNSANDPAENRSVLERIARGELRLVYVAPERLVKPRNARPAHARQGLAARRRRGALHLAMGPRFSSRIRGARHRSGRARRRADRRLHRHGGRRDAHRHSGKAVSSRAGRVRARLRPAQLAPGDASEIVRPPADHRFRQGPSRPERHRLLRLAAQDRGTRRRSAAERRQRAPLSRRHGGGRPLAPSGYVSAG